MAAVICNVYHGTSVRKDVLAISRRSFIRFILNLAQKIKHAQGVCMPLPEFQNGRQNETRKNEKKIHKVSGTY